MRVWVLCWKVRVVPKFGGHLLGAPSYKNSVVGSTKYDLYYRFHCFSVSDNIYVGFSVLGNNWVVNLNFPSLICGIVLKNIAGSPFTGPPAI
jgi:hypothetical protein